MKIREAWVNLTKRLETNTVPDAALEAEVLLRHALNTDRSGFFAKLEENLDSGIKNQVESALYQRLGGKPLAYLVGVREFYGITLKVNTNVLIPRQETELLVDAALNYLDALRMPRRPKLVDIGTGSGAIAIAIAKHFPNVEVVATDISFKALKTADFNLRTYGMKDRINLVCADLAAPFRVTFDLVLSNPPYIKSGNLTKLAPELHQEPAKALDGGVDGLKVVKRLLHDSVDLVSPGGSLMLEVDPDQIAAVGRMAKQLFRGAYVKKLKDLAGIPRVVTVATLPM